MNGNGQKNRNSKKGSATSWMNNINPNTVIGDAQRILKTAVDVLEEEIAAGILAAKKLEKKVINVDEVRNNNPEELMSRVRRDVHDAVDIFLDAVTALTNHFSGLAETFNSKNETSTAKQTGKQTGSAIPVIKHDGPANAGQEVDIPMMITNDSADKEMPFELMKTDLVNQKGNKILSRYIHIEPNAFMIGPLDQKEVSVKIKIPLTCKPGIYSGLFQDNQHPGLNTVITLEVQ